MPMSSNSISDWLIGRARRTGATVGGRRDAPTRKGRRGARQPAAPIAADGANVAFPFQTDADPVVFHELRVVPARHAAVQDANRKP